ncbi:MAG: hypothetical protein EAZ44_00905 [Cytophagia bacterium]|nr:MAG: hypothetical protein EAZ44_00905 [Cytophagia bacterium]TAG44404.1 MAG: hypothetical protein EAZ31_02440 [Cytophagia bacterium]
MRYEEIEPYLIDFLKGKTDEATEYRIKAYLQKFPEFQSELDELKSTIYFVKKTPLADAKPHLKMDFYAMLSDAQKNQKSKKNWLIWLENLQQWWTMSRFKTTVAFGVSLTALTLWFAINNQTEKQKERIVTTQKTQKIIQIDTSKEKNDASIINQKNVDVYAKNQKNDDKATEIVESKHNNNDSFGKSMEIESSSLPIKAEIKAYSRAINKENDSPLNTEKIVKIYQKKVNLQDYLAYIKNNSNVHEQLAALSELEKYGQDEDVRKQVLAQLPYIKNTHSQLVTLDWIVKNHILEGALSLNQLLEQDLHPIVRDSIEDALESM